jgi:tetratricopeptide (TPR) repeat protein
MPQTPPAHPDGQGLLSPSPASGARYLPTIPDTEGQEASPAEGAPAPATHEAETLQNLLREWLNIPDWTTSQVYLQEHPRLLGKQAEQVLEQLHQVPSEGEARELPSTRQALLHDARVWGIPGVCTYYQLAEQVATINAPERELLLQQVQEWLDTPTWEQSQVYLDAHPDLFTSAAEVLLAWLWQVEQTDAARVLLAQHLQLLQRAHIEGSAVAYRELPHPETLNDAATEAMRQYLASGNLADLDNALARWQQALMLISPVDSDRSDLLNLLGLGLHNRYERTGALADLEAAINAYQQAVDLTPPGTPDRPALLHLLGLGLHNHYEHTGALDDLQAAINAYQQAVDLTPPGTPDPALLNMLGSVLHDHYERTGALDDLEAAISVFQQAVDLTPVDSSDRPALLNNLGNELRVRFSRTGEMADLQAAIEACQQAVDLTPVDSSDRPAHLTGLGNGLRARFTRTGALGDLEAAIEAYQQAVDLTPADSSDRPALLNNLGLGLGDRFTRTGGMADLPTDCATRL